jgi:hypothetical protein
VRSLGFCGFHVENDAYILAFLAAQVPRDHATDFVASGTTSTLSSACHLDETIAFIQTLMPLISVGLISNLDETGLSDREERRGKTVLMPVQGAESRLHYPVHRNIRH